MISLNKIGRRQFIQSSVAAYMTASFQNASALNLKAQKLGIVVHSYAGRWKPKVESAKYPGFNSAVDLLEHSASIGASGIQVMVDGWTADFARDVRDRREKLGMYLEGSIGLPRKDEDTPLFEQAVVNAKEAGATTLRTVCLNGRRYENFKTLEAFEEFRKTSIEAVQRAEPIVRKHRMKLAVENHKDWQAAELAEFMKQLSSEWVGVTLDFGNNMALLEEPAYVVNQLLPWLFSTHVKDMGLEEYKDGFLLSEVPLGTGMVDLAGIFESCRRQNPSVTFNLEMITRDPLEIPCMKKEYWATFTDAKARALPDFLKLVKDKKWPSPLPRVAQLPVDDRLAVEEQNIVKSINFTTHNLQPR